MKASPPPVSAADMQALLDRACNDVAASRGKGRVADYIPALARVSPDKFGAAIVTVDGDMANYGDAAEPFSIQSISKIFTLVAALERVGSKLWQRVRREPSGNAFNSIVQLERERGVPRNPLINAGAIVVSDVLLEGSAPGPTRRSIINGVRALADDKSIDFDAEVAASEAENGFRNISLANFIKGFGNLRNPVDEVLDVYFHQCSIAMSCQQLARSMLFLAADGADPITGRQVVSARRARRINSILLLCGHYDASGDFAFRVGIPGKSGVGGGIVAIAPGRAALAVWSPGLERSGTSHTGARALERIVQLTGWHML